MKKSNYYFLLSFFLLIACSVKEKTTEISIIPLPKEVKQSKGEFKFNENTKIIISDEQQRPIAKQLQQLFSNAASYNLDITTERTAQNTVAFTKVNDLPNEAYKLEVNKENISIKSSTYSGFFYGLSSLRQLLPNAIESDKKVNTIWNVPCLTISDSPRFVWRGLMLDLSRHFFEKEYILQTIDRLSAWRVDREKDHWNARKPQQKGEKATYGGFLTQEDVKEIVRYASERGVAIIPEIEMPAHVSSAIAAYPELSCQDKPISVPPGGIWPITDIYCAGNERVFSFLEDVLNEIIPLFPSKYIHIGGDEATKNNWEKCPKCKARMQKEGLKNVEQLQSYFIKRMERFISSKGKVLIGWDEILEGGLAPNATVMSWRGVKGGLEASEQGHNVVMTPGTHCYFDHYQGNPDGEPLAIGGYTTLSKVYEFDPVVDTMSVEQAKHVLGGQANLWAEYIATPKQSEYMIFPRLLALSEVLWTPKEKLNKKEFLESTLRLMDRLDIMGVNYAKSAFDISEHSTVEDNGTIALTLSCEFDSFEIRYALNDEELNANSPLYEKPILISETTKVKAATFKDDKLLGKIWQKTFNFHKAVVQKVAYQKPYDKRYAGGKDLGLVNVLRGSTNFHDGKWQGWLNEDMLITIELKEAQKLHKVTVGSMENQGAHIFFPAGTEVWLSKDGKNFKPVGKLTRPFKKNGYAILKDFEITFEPQSAKYIRVKAKNIMKTPFTYDTWLFVDEIVVE